MPAPPEEDWRSISDQILAILTSTPIGDRLRVFQEELSRLPDGPRKMVEHFVSIALLASADQIEEKVKMNKNFHISFITVITLIVCICLVIAGIYLVQISGAGAVSKINILGANVETNNAGVACLALAAITFIFTVRSAISKL